MADKRMFSKQIVDSDAFLEMPLSTQALYFHLSMRADDDGFLNNASKIRKIIGASEDDMKLLILKKFVISFEGGVIVIKHWRINNYLRNDRYHETVYLEEKSMLDIKKNGAYSLKSDLGIPDCNQSVTQYRVEENREVKDSKEEVSIVECNTHTHEELFDLETAFHKTFKSYPKQTNPGNSRTEWLNRFLVIIPSNHKAMATMIWKAMREYIRHTEEENRNEPEPLKYVKSFDKWIKDDLDYWLAEVERRNGE